MTDVSKNFEAIHFLRRLREKPSLKEAAIVEEHRLAEIEPEVDDVLNQFFLDADRDASLARFMASGAPDDIVDTIRHYFGDRTDLSICEVGAGNGFLCAALVDAGYTDVSLLEPAAEYVTGTGYIRQHPKYSAIRIKKDLDEWYTSPKIYDIIITNACIHHFENPTVAASQIRLKVHDRALWLSFQEFFAFDYEDLLSQLKLHRHARLYGLYEWSYSPRTYIEALRMSGFRAVGMALHTAPYGRRKVKVLRSIHRRMWRFLCDIRLSWTAYALFTALTPLATRRRFRLADPAFMAFVARPIRWDRIAH